MSIFTFRYILVLAFIFALGCTNEKGDLKGYIGSEGGSSSDGTTSPTNAIIMIPSAPVLTLIEGTTAKAIIQFNKPLPRPVTMNWEIANGDKDFETSSGVLTVSADAESIEIPLKAVVDNRFEGDEKFYLKVSGDTNVFLAPLMIPLTIQETGSPLMVSVLGPGSPGVAQQTLTEGAGVETSIFIRLNAAADFTVQAKFTISGTANPTSDYTMSESGSVTFGPGETEKEIKFRVVNDNVGEAAESFILTLDSIPVGNAAVDNDNKVHTINIIDDDLAGAFYVTGITGGTDSKVDSYLTNGLVPTVTWTNVLDEVEYKLLVKNNSNATVCDEVTVPADTLTYTFDPAHCLTPGTGTPYTFIDGQTYKIEARVKVGTTYSYASNAQLNNGYAFIVDSTPPAAFQILGAFGGVDREPDEYLAGSLFPSIAWQNTTGETGYRVAIYSRDSGAEVCAPVNVPANNTSYTFSNCELLRGAYYKATVQALDAAQNVRNATNNNFEFFVTEVPSGYVVNGMTGGTGDISADSSLNDTGAINPGTSVYDPFAFKAEWQGSSGIDHYEVVVLNLNNTVKCPKISTATASAMFFNCRLDLNIQYRLQVIGFDANNIQYPASNSPFTFTFKRGLYLSADPSYPSYYRGIAITSCGGTSKCDATNPYVVNAAFKEDQVVVDKNAVLSAPAWTTGPVDAGNGRLDIEVDYLRIENGGKIDVTGKGSPGSIGTGAGIDAGGIGSGGAYGGNGSLTAAGNQAKAFGSVKNPTDIGSGGGGAGAATGGTGGGALVLKVNQELTFNTGSIEASGKQGGTNAGGGSGGSIILNVKKIAGSGGKIRANGGLGNGTGGPGSGGRVALNYETITHAGGLLGLTLETLPGGQGGSSGTVFYKNVQTVGGDTYGYLSTDLGIYSQTVGVETPIPLYDAADPTGHLFDKIITKGQGTFIVESGKVYTLQSSAPTPSLDFRLVLAGDLLMPSGTAFQISGSGYLEWRRVAPNDKMDMFTDLTILGGGVLTHSPNLGSKAYSIDIHVTNNFNLFGTIDVNSKGYAKTYGIGASSGVEGAGYGGQGGFFSSIVARGNSYGKITQPDYLGAGSATVSGGGQVKIKVDNDFNLSGSITANGSDGCGGGSGGSVWIDAKNVTGSGGSISSQGGGSTTGNCGGGSGGRVAVYYQTTNYPGGITGINYLISGGDAVVDGAAGTVFHKKVGTETYGNLMVMNTIRDYNDKIATPLGVVDNPEQYDSIVTDSRGTILITSDFVSPSSYVLPSDSITYRVIAEGDFVLPAGSDLKINDGGYLEVRRAAPYTFNSLTVTANGLLTHTSNTSSKQYLIHFIVNDLNLDGVIDVSRRGYAGGYGPGLPTVSTSFGAGHGGYGGNGGLYTTGLGGVPYSDANIKAPDEFGSGSANFVDGSAFLGAAGGGYVRFDVANDFNFKGQIFADGGTGVCGSTKCNGGGSGGSIFITATNVKGVNGTLSANGGNGGGGSGACGAGGRISLVYNSDALYAEGTVRKLISYEKIRAFGGTLNNARAGAAGSIYFKSASNTNGDLIYNNGGNPHPQKTETLIPMVSYDSIQTLNKATLIVRNTDTFTIPSDLTYRIAAEGTINLPASLNIKNGGYLEWRKNSNINLTNLTIESGGTLSHSYNYTTDAYRLNLNISNDLNLNGGGAIDVSYRGLQPGYKNNGSGTIVSGSTGAGAYGGMSGSGNLPYGNYANPDDLGSAGAAGSGGGAARVIVGGTATINGTIYANGTNMTGGSGAGGSILLDTNILAGSTGALRANGGADNSWGGSGGRITVLYNTDNYPINYLTMTAYGGDSAGTDGAAGTIFYRKKNDVLDLGHLIIANTGRSMNVNITTALPQDELSTVVVDTASAVEVKSGQTVRLPTASVGYRLIVAGTLKLPVSTNTLTIENNGVVELRTSNVFGSKVAGLGDVRNIKIKPLGKLTHTANPAGAAPWTPTYKVNLDLDTLEVQGAIDVTGKGFPAANGPCGKSSGGSCYGGAPGNGLTVDTDIYGSISNPLSLGSGSGSASYGGAGGGLVQMDVNTLNLSGQIIADGGRNPYIFGGSDGGASGGSVNLKMATLTGGGGRIYSRGNSNPNCGGGGGRIAVDVGADSYTGGLSNMVIAAFGGTSGSCFNGGHAAAGTVYLKGPMGPGNSIITRLVLNNGAISYKEGVETYISENLSVDEVVVGSASTGIYVPAGIVFEPKSSDVFYQLRVKGDVKFPNASVSPSYNPATDNWGDVVVKNGGSIIYNRAQDFAIETTRFIYNSFVMESGATVTHTANTVAPPNIYAVNIQTRSLFHLKSDATINVNGRGYGAGVGAGGGLVYGNQTVSGIWYPAGVGGSGGSYGGVGGGYIRYLNGAVSPTPTWSFVAPAKPVYGLNNDPLFPGSGGGGGGGLGGGLVVLRSDDQFILEGRILANGTDGQRYCPSSCTFPDSEKGWGGGSGGGINITAKFFGGGYATLQAHGGNSGNTASRYGGAGGGGGRIAVKFPKPYDSVNGGSTYSGTLSYDVLGGAAFIDTGTSWDASNATTISRTLYQDIDGTTRQGTAGTYYENP